MTEAGPTPPPAAAGDRPAVPPRLAWGLIAGLAAAIWLAAAAHEGQLLLAPKWRLLAVFLPTVLAPMLRPLPGGAAVLLAVLAAVLVGALSLKAALGGYREPTVWPGAAPPLPGRLLPGPRFPQARPGPPHRPDVRPAAGPPQPRARLRPGSHRHALGRPDPVHRRPRRRRAATRHPQPGRGVPLAARPHGRRARHV